VALSTGDCLGTYEIVSALGAGGMGEVYRAHDTRLDRDVAVKVLSAADLGDATARARLIHEARTASKLNHPNVCTIHDVGETEGRVYIAMELVEGEPLSALAAGGPLPPDRIVRYATQIAGALSHAHHCGVIHRDLKSANVMITRDGRAKILDFGLAKRVGGDAAAATTIVSLAGPGTISGTIAYMAPEVLRGAEADARSDIWSLGIVMFEMAAGRRPFAGASVYEVTSAILTTAAPQLPPTVPQGLQTIVRKCLAKEPGERYQQASEVGAALEATAWSSAVEPRPAPARVSARSRAMAAVVAIACLAGSVAGWFAWRSRHVGGSARPQVRALAVLPLANLSGDGSQDLFADGMTEALITDLARVKGLDVISRTSVMQYRNSTKRLPEIARELGVDAVVEGSVLRAGDRVRISAQLIEAATDRHLWAEEYERDLRDVLSLQREVARAIAHEVRITLTPQEEAGLKGGRRVDTVAHDLYLRGRALVFRFNEPSIAEAIGLLEESTRIDPEFAEAWAALASAHAERGIWGTPKSSRETATRAREAVTRALALDSSSGEAYAVLGFINTVYEWDWVAAERALKRSIELAPGDARTHTYYTALLMALRRSPESIAEAEVERRLDPASPLSASSLGRSRYRGRQFDLAIAAFNDGIRLDPTYTPNYGRLADVYVALGQYDEALTWLDKEGEISGVRRRATGRYGYVYAMAGRRREAETVRQGLIEQARTNDQALYPIAQLEAALGNRDTAFMWLNRAHDARSATLFLVNGEPKFDALRDDPRFEDLLHRMRFPGH